MTDIILRDFEDGVLLLTLNRPDKLNALNLALAEGLVFALDVAEADEDVRVIVITGVGRAFSAGADLKEFADKTADNAEANQRRSDMYARLNGMVPGMSKPVIAAVNGLALGGGCGLVVSCDMAIASETATFSYPELKHGMVPAGVLPPLAGQVGRKAAFDLMGTGRTFDAAEAMRLGIVSRIVKFDDLLDSVMETADLLAGYPRDAMSGLKRLLDAVVNLPLADGLAFVKADKEKSRR
ncbi:MAG: enoyl-CoA hydratase/isomerase family protein [Rhodospirillaceae bacterium]|jgi:enoyl-CoA hydratase/carnithine racemase|nr:enoyl-CoA hydratase/isomerase family protein [Rhodospirillaceae bacterium]MBT5457629.1 enoyl-CoA hydratase/isomerase family protein [Rhodospirillaceae bacterium]